MRHYRRKRNEWDQLSNLHQLEAPSRVTIWSILISFVTVLFILLAIVLVTIALLENKGGLDNLIAYLSSIITILTTLVVILNLMRRKK